MKHYTKPPSRRWQGQWRAWCLKQMTNAQCGMRDFAEANLRGGPMWRHAPVVMAAVFAADVLIARSSAQERSKSEVVAVSQPTMAAVSKMRRAGFMVLEWIDGTYLMLVPHGMTAESAADFLQATIPELGERRPVPTNPCEVRAHHCVK